MKSTQGKFFNRLWVEDQDVKKPNQQPEYVPAHKRPGFDESKVIKLNRKGEKK